MIGLHHGGRRSIQLNYAAAKPCQLKLLPFVTITANRLLVVAAARAAASRTAVTS
jgi:hypothetical protein